MSLGAGAKPQRPQHVTPNGAQATHAAISEYRPTQDDIRAYHGDGGRKRMIMQPFNTVQHTTINPWLGPSGASSAQTYPSMRPSMSSEFYAPPFTAMGLYESTPTSHLHTLRPYSGLIPSVVGPYTSPCHTPALHPSSKKGGKHARERDRERVTRAERAKFYADASRLGPNRLRRACRIPGSRRGPQ